jgi:hypothetical protein
LTNDDQYYAASKSSVLKNFFFNYLIQQICYLVIIEKCDQDTNDVLNIASIVIQQLRKDYPFITELLVRSDNAGCYSSNGYIEVMSKICTEHGIKLLRYDYSEPQKGKDQADRESAVFKGFAKACIRSGGNVRCAGGLKKAIQFNGGPRSTKIAIAKTYKTPETQISNFKKIPLISYYHSVELKGNSCTFWRHYNIGSGVKVTWGDAKFQQSIKVTDGFDNTNGSERILPMERNSIRKLPQFCPVSDCEAGFLDIKDLEEHLRAGKHGIAMERTDDILIFQHYSQHANATVFEYKALNLRENHSAPNYFPIGWALQIRKSRRLDNDVKSFITQLFLKGEKSNQKMSPEVMFQEIKSAQNGQGENMFDASQFLTTKQIKGLISRLTKMFQSGKLTLNDLDQSWINSETLEEVETSMEIEEILFSSNDEYYIES